MNILIVGPSWVGDMVMAQTLFKAIKSREPNSVIDVLAPDWSRPLLERMPEIREAIPLSIPHGQLDLKERLRLARMLREKNYQKAIVLPNSLKSALIPWLAGIPHRVGFRGEMRYGLLNDIRVLDKHARPRMIDRFLALEELKKEARISDFYPSLFSNIHSIEKTLAKFSLNVKKQPILALCPGAEFGASKRWPEHYYAAIANEKIKEGYTVFLFGSKNDKAVALSIQNQTQGKCHDFTGETTLEEAIDLLSLATIVVSNDSGLMHIAAALRKPLLVIYGSTDPRFTPPLNQTAKIIQQTLPCSPCFQRECPLRHHQCMRQVVPEMVLKEIEVFESQLKVREAT